MLTFTGARLPFRRRRRGPHADRCLTLGSDINGAIEQLAATLPPTEFTARFVDDCERRIGLA